jgi:hypothetical protein
MGFHSYYCTAKFSGLPQSEAGRKMVGSIYMLLHANRIGQSNSNSVLPLHRDVTQVSNGFDTGEQREQSNR